MSDLAPHDSSAAPARADADNRYKAVQAKLKKLSTALTGAAVDLEHLRRDMRANADRTERVAEDIDRAELDTKFVDLTHHVAAALHGAAAQLRTLHDTAQETADLTHQARRTHAQRYGALDDIRSTRPERTPKPGFLAS
ncbi:conjugal transfer protein TraB [Streptomyces xinghaiensis]|uniref:Conjugal transfer protein TraB n=2 Tax=Streptomyces TaxID=1883 RepID=A0A3R7IN97_9ACTN|nr:MULTISPECIES: hypothetical protein [Streptomyces]KNE83378.1 conjugal transfer protein TraB [Streptomyces fradiae]OFA37592.1 conjugal transfer protein TraB [Streptomyces fradiae]PQM20531.1 conjugal transfer protein TraB [Streptomyces xinghaiensis]RKM92473.1 conjugal transfer protein TraB [Streptomyces xinghaiensis]RNC70440.1 conjugal transfer protein TraB [Streptomyces xinghaiensis]